MSAINIQTGTIAIDTEGVGSVVAHRLKTLPKVARDKIKALNRTSSRTEGQRREISERRRKLGERRSALNEQINHAESEIQGGWVRYAPEDLARVSGWRAEVVECNADIEACAAEYKAVPGGLRPDAILEWIRSEPSGRRYRACIPTVALKKNETAFVALSNIRVEIAEFEKQVTLADVGGLPLVEVEKRVVAEIAALATRGKPSFAAALHVHPARNGRRSVGRITWPTAYIQGSGRYVDDGLAFCVWANQKAITEAAVAELRARVEPDALSFQERDLRIAECRAAILESERHEEALVLLCEVEKIDVQRRYGAHPLAVLQIQIDQRSP